jgi:hypothetical protein
VDALKQAIDQAIAAGDLKLAKALIEMREKSR